MQYNVVWWYVQVYANLHIIYLRKLLNENRYHRIAFSNWLYQHFADTTVNSYLYISHTSAQNKPTIVVQNMYAQPTNNLCKNLKISDKEIKCTSALDIFFTELCRTSCNTWNQYVHTFFHLLWQDVSYTLSMLCCVLKNNARENLNMQRVSMT